MTAKLEIEQQEKNGWAVLSPAGEIDLASVELLETRLADLARNSIDRVLIDLTGVTFLDSTGLRTLLSAHTRLAEEGGTLALVVSGGPVERLLDITGVGSTLTIHPSLEAATA
ncbi:MAG TPA: STAS domain-containing protein [Acidimicrobiia bacterium]|nr:STAS domain-containing protein [Acidimicrobiia bacterium]